MSKLVYFGTVDGEGALTLTNYKAFRVDLNDFKGKEVRITVERKSKRSNPQNSYFHGVIIPIVKAHLIDLGWKDAKSTEWVKNYIKYNCLIIETENEDTGEVVKTLGETSSLTKPEFMEFVADVQQWAIEKLGLQIPDPGQALEMEF
ncbi:MAG: hypothetical protein JWR05_3522 [Mucilaginibacter sp.]|nr:hypothetical protein [Mucilaginibacter sp.]